MTKFSKKLSIIIPVYNEKNTIEKVLDKISKIKHVKKEIIVVDDFSDDGSSEILRANKKKISKGKNKLFWNKNLNSKKHLSYKMFFK